MSTGFSIFFERIYIDKNSHSLGVYGAFPAPNDEGGKLSTAFANTLMQNGLPLKQQRAEVFPYSPTQQWLAGSQLTIHLREPKVDRLKRGHFCPGGSTIGLGVV